MTDASDTTHARVREVWAAALAAAVEVVRRLRVTEQELHAAAEFLNTVGRQGVFPSLLDSSLAMTSVETLRTEPGATRPNLLGPYYRPGAPSRPDGDLRERPTPPHHRVIEIDGTVTDHGEPVVGAQLDLWHADGDGEYDHDGWHLRGIVDTDQAGRYRIVTVVPDDYTEHSGDAIGDLFRMLGSDGHRAAHVHVIIRHAGRKRLTTQIFVPTSQKLDQDYVVGAVTSTLIAAPSADGQKLTFDFRLPSVG